MTKLQEELIRKISSIQDENLLQEIFNFIEESVENEEVYQLSEEQIEIIKQSEKDIENGNFITQEELDKQDLEWLKNL